jgi:ADP-ribose pyrophosphatase YjhB (NUDIX family)
MTKVPRPKLLEWVERLAAVAQTGLTFTPGVFDRERYAEVRRIAAEMAAFEEGDVERIEALFAGATGYATPKLITRVAVFRDQQVLMVQEAADGGWTLPGGWVDVGEAPAGAAEREVREESGYLVRAVKLAGVYDKLRRPYPVTPFHAYLLYFICELEGGEPAPSLETLDVGWFDEDRLPPLSPGRVTEAEIRRMFEHHRRPDLPTDFD